MKQLSVVLSLASVLLLSACSSKTPTIGSPEWLWAAARESYLAGDVEKATDHLERIDKMGNNPFVDRARAWRLLLEAGSANASMELAKAYEDGWLQTRTEKTAYARQRSAQLQEAKRHGIGLYEGYGAFAKSLSDKPIVLEFPFPKGSAAMVTEMDRVYKGMSMPEEQRATAHDKVLQRGIVRAVDAALATEDDSATAQQALKAGHAEAPPARYLLALALSFHRASAAFERRNLNEPDKQKLFQDRALEVVKRALELKPQPDVEKELKKLQADIEKGIKEKAGGKKARA